MDFNWIEHWVWENNYSDEISKWISLELGEINPASERKNFSCQRGSWMMSGWKAWTDVLPEGGNICGWVSDVNGIISSVQAEAAIKTHLDNFAPTKRKHNFVIYFKVYCYERWKSMSLRTQGEGTKDDKHLRNLEGKMLMKTGMWKSWRSQNIPPLRSCILPVSVEKSHEIASCPNTNDHLQSISCLILEFNS